MTIALPEPTMLRSIAWWGRELAARTGDKTLAWSIRLIAAVDRGEALLPLRFVDGWPVTCHAGHVPAVLSARDVGLWLKAAGFSVEHDGAAVIEHDGAAVIELATQPEDEPRRGPIAPALREELRERARQRIRAIRRAERRDPLLPEIANYVASWMAQHEIYGSHGHALSAETVRRHALIGILKTA